ncbi:MAG: hypothetical protein ACKOFA_05555 [Rhodoluna sp.]
MTNKKQKTYRQQIRDLEAQIEKLTGSLTTAIQDNQEEIEDEMINWLRNDESFAGFRNTYARVLISLLSIVVLFGYGYYAFMNPELSLWYLGLICLVLVMQAISVRFVFNFDEKSSRAYSMFARFFTIKPSTRRTILDEYQLRRRDKALQRAHGSFVGLLGLALVGAFLYGYQEYFFGEKEFSFTPMPDAVYSFSLSGGQFLVLAFFISGWISLQKYWSYGIKGEPFLSRSESEKLRDS